MDGRVVGLLGSAARAAAAVPKVSGGAAAHPEGMGLVRCATGLTNRHERKGAAHRRGLRDEGPGLTTASKQTSAPVCTWDAAGACRSLEGLDMTHCTATDTQPGNHPAWCHPLHCTPDNQDPRNPLHGSEPTRVLTGDCEFEIGTLADTTDAFVSLAAESLPHTCACGHELRILAFLSPADVLALIGALSAAMSLGGVA